MSFMRVVHLITGLNQGGAEAMLEKLLLAARKANPEIPQSVISFGDTGVVGRRLVRAGIHVEALGLSGLSPRTLKQLMRLALMLRRQRPDAVVQTWLWHADLVGGLCARAVGNRRVVWNLRNSMPQLASTKRLSRATALLCARLSGWLPAKIVCNSQAALRAHAAIGYDRGKCIVIPNGFDLDKFIHSAAARQRIRESWGAQPGDLFVGMVARVDAQKDHATFIRAALRVAKLYPGVRFVLVGAGVTEDQSIKSLLSELSLIDRFVLQERREDVPEVMSALDVFCLASKSEGFPNVLGEAMACATPAIAADTGDAREIIGERFLFPVGDSESLADRILQVLSLSREERCALGIAHRREVERRFDIKYVWYKYRDLYLSIYKDT
jgi:glycosyltransferase involved in cell wall biosynthesis